MKAFNKFQVNFALQDFPLRLDLLRKFSCNLFIFIILPPEKADVCELTNTHSENRCEARKREL